MRHPLGKPQDAPDIDGTAAHLTNSQLQSLAIVSKQERRILTALLVFVLIFVVLDFFDDSGDGTDWLTILVDVVFGGLILATIIYLWKNTPFSTKRTNLLLNQEIAKKHKDSEAWRAKSRQLIAGLTQAIDEQLNDWNLTKAEKEVALMLLKGFSLKEIAILRNTTERTVRQQASSIYAKANLSSRAELSAFFLEDFLSPIDEVS